MLKFCACALLITLGALLAGCGGGGGDDETGDLKTIDPPHCAASAPVCK